MVIMFGWSFVISSIHGFISTRTVTISAFFENLKEKEFLGFAKKNIFCVQMGDLTQNMIFLMTYIDPLHVKWAVSKKFSFPSTLLQWQVRHTSSG